MIAMALFQDHVAAVNLARWVPPLRPFVCIGQIRKWCVGGCVGVSPENKK